MKGKGKHIVASFFVAMSREFSYKFYHSKLWKDTREVILKRDNYLCVKCGMPAEEVHHKIHLSPDNIDDESISINPANLISLCKACHFEEHRGEHGTGRQVKEENHLGDYYFDENGFLVESPHD